MRTCLPLLTTAVCLLSCAQKEATRYATWETYKGSDESVNYSSLSSVDTSNVQQLAIAWSYSSGDADTVNSSQVQCNPIVVGGVLYGINPKMNVFAVDAATGREIWKFDPFDSIPGEKRLFFILNNSRGVRYWSDGRGAQRIYFTAGSFLYALDAVTGKRVPSFGNNGRLDLHEGLGRDVSDLFITSTTPAVIHDSVLVIGSRVDEGPRAAPGHIRGYNVRTGKQVWIFHTIPQPGEFGYDTWSQPSAWQYTGGANNWCGMSVDHQRGLIFAVTGSASYDWYGGQRLGDNLFANCIIALEAATGKRKWHFQYIHHDVWDRDFSSAPALVSFTREGKRHDAAVITTKTGMVFMFDRETGKPIYRIEERAVPVDSDLAGEKLSPTQPYPVKPAPFMRQSFTAADVNPLLSPSSQDSVRAALARHRADHIFNPPSLHGTIMFPGLDGGAEWGGPAVDPETGILYINANEMPWLITAVPVAKNTSSPTKTYRVAGGELYQAHCMSCHGAEKNGSGNYPDIDKLQSRYTFNRFDSLLQSGRRMMPAFAHLSIMEREAIASYVLGNTGLESAIYPSLPGKINSPYDLPYTIAGYTKFMAPGGLPAIAPPWGTLNALDLSTGEYIWQQPLGHDKRFPQSKSPTGTENYGAGVVTAGGLIFIAATSDAKFRAFRKRDGKLLWETDLPAAAFATPAVYEIKGKQFIVIACGGGKLGTKSGDRYVAFSLPDKKSD